MPKTRPPQIGQVFGRLIVLEVIGRYARCRCTCGKTTLPKTYRLWSGHTQSCGCYGRTRALRHGDTSSVGRKRTVEYQAWENMRRRCTNPKAKDYKHYGARGITVCDRWLMSYTAFLSDMGRKPTPRHTLERRNNDGPYSPDNCVWATMSEQHRNKRYLGRRPPTRAPYWLRTRDDAGPCYRLIIPRRLPPEWRVPISA